MSVEVVKYHNDFNKVGLGSFNELEQNLLFGILVECRNKQDIEFELSADDLARFVKVRRNVTNDELFKMACDLSKNFLKLDFRVVKRDGNRICRGFFNLFETLVVCSIECDNYEILEKIIIKVNPDFAYLINQLAEHFTQFELEEFIFLKGRYTKTLYRYLKQFRTTGVWRVTWDNFKMLLDIPKSYKMCDIDKQILEPSVKQLQEPLNLFERARTPFKNLKYRKIKGKGRGRGGNVTHIEFTFDKQTAQGEPIADFMGQEIAPSQAKEYKEPQKLEPIFIQRLREIQKKKAIIFNNQEYFILNIVEQDESFLIHLSKDAKFPKNDFYTKFSLERAEQLAKDNNLI
ncbi:MAG: replication initiation protein [Campylobacter sp.]|nr:replication initiation protein [Campylobacter sp.]